MPVAGAIITAFLMASFSVFSGTYTVAVKGWLRSVTTVKVLEGEEG